MNIDLISAHSPKWANEEGTAIDCMATFSHLREELPFTACVSDVEPHGRALFDRCIQGEFGVIAPYAARPTPSACTSASDGTVPVDDTHPGWPSIHEFLSQANSENQGNSIRGIGLVWGSMLEDMLERLITKELGKREKADRLVFGKKIEKAFDKDLIDETTKAHLEAIKSVRNRCAHDWNLTLSNKRLVKTLPKLVFLRDVYFPSIVTEDDLEILMKLVYTSACMHLILEIAHRLSQQ